MRQGKRQALFHIGFESVSEDEEELSTVESLLDGWFTKYNNFIEIGTVLNVSPEVLSFHLSTVDEFDQIGIAGRFADNFFDTTNWTTESAAAIHAPANVLPYYVLQPLFMNAEGWIDLEEIIYQRVRAGQKVSVRTESVPLGTVNTTGLNYVNQEIKFVVSENKFSKSAGAGGSDRQAMRFAALFQQDDKLAVLPIAAPCAGYYTNIRMQFISDAGSSADDPWNFWFGTDMDQSVMDALPDTSSEIATMPDMNKNAVYANFALVEINEAEGFHAMITKHWGNKRVYVDEDDIPKIFTQMLGTPTNDNFWLIQADFVPKKGALFKLDVSHTDMAPDDDWQELPITVPFDMDNVELDITLRGDATQVAAEFIWKMMIVDPNQQVILAEDTFSGTITGDIIKEMNASPHQRHEKNIVGTIQGSFVAGGSNNARATIRLPKLLKGQRLSYAYQIIDGALADGLDTSIQFSGIVANYHKSYGANFLSGSQIMDLSGESSL